MSDVMGRKRTVAVANSLIVVGGLGMGVAPDIFVLIGGRLIAGIGIGISAMAVPIYLAELSPPAYRGRLIALSIASISLGQLVSSLVCLALSSWRWMLGVSVFPPLLQILGLMHCPESPKWLYSQGKTQQAKAALKAIYRLETAISTQIRLLEEQNDLIPSSFSYTLKCRELFTTHKKAFLIGGVLQGMQQLSGMNNVMYYGPTVMRQAGVEGRGKQELWAAALIYAVTVVGMMLGVKLIDKAGRRPLLLWTLPLLTCFLLGLAGSFYLLNYHVSLHSTASILCLVFSLLFVFSFGLGLGPVPWTLNAELYPLHLRSTANSFATALNRLGNILASMTFLSMTDSALGEVVTWVCYAGMAVVTWMWTWWLVPETKGIPLEAVQALLERGRVGK